MKLFGSAALGGLLGTIGAYIQGRMELQKKREENKFELDKMDKDRQMMEMELQNQARIEGIRGDTAVAVAEAELMETSYAADKATYSSGLDIKGAWGKVAKFLLFLVDFFRGIVRPSVTAYSILLLTWVTVEFLRIIPLETLLKQNPELFWKVFENTIMTVLFISTLSVSWWFGARTKKFN